MIDHLGKIVRLLGFILRWNLASSNGIIQDPGGLVIEETSTHVDVLGDSLEPLPPRVFEWLSIGAQVDVKDVIDQVVWIKVRGISQHTGRIRGGFRISQSREGERNVIVLFLGDGVKTSLCVEVVVECHCQDARDLLLRYFVGCSFWNNGLRNWEDGPVYLWTTCNCSHISP